MRLLTFLACLALAAPAAAQTEWRQARDYEVLLSSFDIQPDPIRLKAGEPLRLRLTNNSSIAHSFNSEAFFAKAQVRPRERELTKRGKIEVPAGTSREILLVPAAGRYSARCGSLYHRLLGMRADIIVE
jgi:uncharacterized cupredoxin-like copper-binding protein